jgi:hypothetical protein
MAAIAVLYRTPRRLDRTSTRPTIDEPTTIGAVPLTEGPSPGSPVVSRMLPLSL